MKSVTLKSRPPNLGACLDDLLSSRFLPRVGERRLLSAGELPSRLERCANNLLPNSEWRAYGGEDQLLFAIGRTHAADAQAVPATAIDAYFLDANAVVYAAGVWEYDGYNGWWLDAVLNLSSDWDHRWWLTSAMDPRPSFDTSSHPPGPRPGIAQVAPRIAAPDLQPPKNRCSSCGFVG